MLTTRALMSLTPQKVRDRTTRPSVMIVKDDLRYLTYGAKTPTRRLFLKVSLHNDESSGRPYSVAIRAGGSGGKGGVYLIKGDTKLWVHCSCPYFFYYLEVVLTKLGSSSISKDNQAPLPRTSNKAMPNVTNPTYSPYVCKHIWAALSTLLRLDKDKKEYAPLIRQKRKEKDLFKKKADEYGKRKKEEPKKEASKTTSPKKSYQQNLNDYGKRK